MLYNDAPIFANAISTAKAIFSNSNRSLTSKKCNSTNPEVSNSKVLLLGKYQMMMRTLFAQD
jgi:hypothetical protein